MCKLAILAVLFSVVSLYASQNILGGFFNISVKDKVVIRLVDFAVKEYNQNRSIHYGLLSIVNARQQIVNGFNYELSILVKSTICKQCSVYKCVHLVRTKDWKNYTKLNESSCKIYVWF
jgi:hypothetical protein